MTVTDAAQTAFLAREGWGEATRARLAGDASNRRYDRLTRPDGATAVLMIAPPETGEETGPFVRMARFLTDAGLSAPRILGEDRAQGLLLLEDLGDALFARLMSREPARSGPLYAAATDLLVTLHRVPPLPLRRADADWLSEMVDPFFEWYPQAQGTEGAQRAKALIRSQAASLVDTPFVVALRDYHAENLLWLPDRAGVARVGLLDFQDAVCAHPAYDLVSILQDARRDVSAEIEEAMIARYLAATGMEGDAFRAAYALLGAQRNLRILGIFARLCRRDGKPGYLDMMPRVWHALMRDLAHPTLRALRDTIRRSAPAPDPDVLKELRAACPTCPVP